MCTVAHTTILPPVTRVTCQSWHSTCHLFREGWFLSPIRLWQGHLCNSFHLKALAGQSLADILKSQLLRRLRLTSVRPSWARLCKAILSCVESLVWWGPSSRPAPHPIHSCPHCVVWISADAWSTRMPGNLCSWTQDLILITWECR